MDINTTQQFNINQTSIVQSKTSLQNPLISEEIKFADELTKVENENTEPVPEEDDLQNVPADTSDEVEQYPLQDEIIEDAVTNDEEKEEKNQQAGSLQIDSAIGGLKEIVTEINKIGQKDEKLPEEVKPVSLTVDKEEKTKAEDNTLIDNNMNIQEPADKVNIQTETGTNFNNNGQPFAEFMNKEQKVNALKSTEKEIAEEKAVLSTMEENIAIANKNMLLKEKAEKDHKADTVDKTERIQPAKVQKNDNDTDNEPVQKNITVQNDEGIKRVDAKTHLTVETIVSYENIIMDKSDVDFFVNLVDKESVNLSDVQSAAKSAHVSKTLADLLAKAMNENKPVRIDFDNDISVIIKIDRAGKISADFLPSSQIAEAYLKENLPLLRQRFNDNNIDYNELNQRKQKQDTQDNRKKGRKDE